MDLLPRLQADLHDKYAVERELGRGGMATVYLARDLKLDRKVAVKVLHPDLGIAVGADRFRREIQIVTRLTHPNILPIFDSGEAAGSLYYVMPFVDGESLRQKLDREQQLSVEDAVRITCEVASALDYAHKHGVIHRDIKPENILLEDGHAITADFGIARAVSEAGGERLTQTGVTLGTPTYMSPEQAMAERAMDGRTDIYSLACVLYEMLAGQPPFVGANAQAVIARHTMDEVPQISIVRASVPEGIEDAIMQALSKVPADRFATAAEFSASLCGQGPRFERRTVARARKRQPTTRRRGAMLALIAMPVLAAAAGGLWWANNRTSVAHASGLNPNRIAVLYLETEEGDDSLAFLAEGLTESLIDELDRVEGLEVISANGVLPFREGSPTPDSVAGVLRTGTLVQGSVEEAGDRIRVAIRLVEGESGADFDRAIVERPKGDLLALRDTLSKQVAELLRVKLGSEVQLREDRNATRSPEAWSLAQRAERARKDAADLVIADSAQRAAARIADADSLLAAAELSDPRWVTPVVRRARLTLQQLRTTRDPLERGKLIATGLEHAERAIALQPRNAEALELRGTLRFTKHTLGLAADPVEAADLVRTAEQDLRQSIAIDKTSATALNALSSLLHRTYERTEANLLAQQAYEADAYLAAAPDIIWRLYTTSYDLQDFASATKWCRLGGERYPQQSRFHFCQLRLMGTNVRQPDVPEAWSLVDRIAERTPSAARDAARREAQMMAAVPIFRAGLADSARRVLERARAGRDVDPRGELIGAEAVSRTLIGDHDEAIELLQSYLTSHPEHREGFVKANTWWWQPLKSDPRYKALVGIEN